MSLESASRYHRQPYLSFLGIGQPARELGFPFYNLPKPLAAVWGNLLTTLIKPGSNFSIPFIKHAKLSKHLSDMEETSMSNGTHTPQTPESNGLSLTEYSANPSPPPGKTTKSTASSQVPEAYLLPDGFPDVSMIMEHKSGTSANLVVVSTSHTHVPSLRCGQGDPLDTCDQPQ